MVTFCFFYQDFLERNLEETEQIFISSTFTPHLTFSLSSFMLPVLLKKIQNQLYYVIVSYPHRHIQHTKPYLPDKVIDTQNQRCFIITKTSTVSISNTPVSCFVLCDMWYVLHALRSICRFVWRLCLLNHIMADVNQPWLMRCRKYSHNLNTNQNNLQVLVKSSFVILRCSLLYLFVAFIFFIFSSVVHFNHGPKKCRLQAAKAFFCLARS